MQFGGDPVQSISASKRNYIVTKNWHIILVKKTRVLVVSYSYFPTQCFDIHLKVKGRRDRNGGSFFLKQLSLQNIAFTFFLCK